MASTEFQLSTYMRARLDTWESDVSTNNNTSVVHARVVVWRTNSWSGQTYSSSVRREIWIDGSCVCDWTGEISHYASYGEIEVASGSKTITHNADGTKSVGVQAYLTDNVSGYFSGSGSLTMGLTTIARQVNISSVTGSFTDENLTPTVKWTNNGNRVDLKIELPDLGVNPWKRWNSLQGGSSYSPTFSQADINNLLSRIPNATTLKLRFTVTTVINGTDSFFSYIDKTFSVVHGNPTFSNYTYADTNSATTAITGNNQVMISGKSTLAVTISAANKATAKKSATMSKYTFQVAGLSATENYTTSAITKTIGSPTVAASETPSATRDLVVTALDSRNLTTAVKKTITIVPYASPTISATATRANGFENTTTVKISGTFSRIEVGGTAKNTVNASSGVAYRYRQQGTSTWGSWTNKAATVNTSTGKVTVADFTLNLNNQYAYEFEFRIIDKLETKTSSLTVSIGQPAFWIGADGRAGVGQMPTNSLASGEAGLLEVKGRIFYGKSNRAQLVDPAINNMVIRPARSDQPIETTFVFIDTKTTTTQTLVSNKGTSIGFELGDNASVAIRTGGENILMAKIYASLSLTSNITSSIGLSGRAADTKAWTYYSGINNGNPENKSNGGIAPDGNETVLGVASYWGDILVDQGGTKGTFTTEYTMQRYATSNTKWWLFGNYQNGGSFNAIQFRTECTAAAGGCLPNVYQRGAGGKISKSITIITIYEKP